MQINYQSIGSGCGIQQLKNGAVGGACDMALDDDALKNMPAIVQIPESAEPGCITYNLPNLNQPLKLSGASLSGIYLGAIKNWQDATITRQSGANLPHQNIVVGHRSDGSGTGNIFTTYLAVVSSDWNKKVGKGLSVSWPIGRGGKSSEGVTGLVKQTPALSDTLSSPSGKKITCPSRPLKTRQASSFCRLRKAPQPLLTPFPWAE